MGCSNARLLVQTSLNENNTPATSQANNVQATISNLAASNETAPTSTSVDLNSATSRMHLTGVDLVVERNGSYTLLLTPKTHKQLMPYVLRKKRFRILVDKARSEGTSTGNQPLTSYESTAAERYMESEKELKLNGKKGKKQSKQGMESTIESVQKVASDELDKAKARFVVGRSIDRGNPEDEDQNIQSDDEGMIEEIITTVEEDKDLECKVKKKIETKKTIAQDPETHNKITKVVKTEVTEITRTITISDEHDLERAKRELGIDDVNKLLPSSQMIYNLPATYHSATSWIDHPRLTQVQEKYYDPANEIVTSGDFPSDSPVKQNSPEAESPVQTKSDQPLADATTVGRGAVVESIQTVSPTIGSSEKVENATASADQTNVAGSKKKKKSSLSLCSCTRSTANDYDEEKRKQKAATIVEQKSKQKKKISSSTNNAVVPATTVQAETTNVSHIDQQPQGQPLISPDVKQLIIDRKDLIIDYVHSKIFLPSKLFGSNNDDEQSRKISSRILDLLHYDRCSSWTNLFDQVNNEYSEQSGNHLFLQPMVKTYEDLFTNKQSDLLNTFSSIDHEKDVRNLPENQDCITIVQTYVNERENQLNIGVITKPFVENSEETPQSSQDHAQTDDKVMDADQEKKQPLVSSTEIDMTDKPERNSPIYDEEQLSKMLANISQDRPITLAEAIAYQYIDLEDPKLGLSSDTIVCIKNLFKPLPNEDKSSLNSIRIHRSGKPLSDVNLAETNPLEKFHSTEPLIYQLQQTFEPTLDFNEKQFRSLADTILSHKDEFSDLRFDVGRTLLPFGDMKESSTNDFSQSDSGYSMTTTTHDSLASKVKNEFETITEPITDALNASEKSLDAPVLLTEVNVDSTESKDLSTDLEVQTIQQTETKPAVEQTEGPTAESLVKEETVPAPTKTVKKRKSAGLFSCFGSKKSKASTEQKGQATIEAPKSTDPKETIVSPTTDSVEEKVATDYAILPDGKRIYIDLFQDRPGLDMSYRPPDFDDRFTLPAAKSPADYERPLTPEITPTPVIQSESRSVTIDSVEIHHEIVEEPVVNHAEAQPESVEQLTTTQVESIEEKVADESNVESVVAQLVDESLLQAAVQEPVIEKETLESESKIVDEQQVLTGLEAASINVESVDIVTETKDIVKTDLKADESAILKPLANLHGASVTLPEVELVSPGPLPSIPVTKEKTKKTKKPKEETKQEKTAKPKKSSGGLCGSCFGAKAAEKKKEKRSTTAKEPIEPNKVEEQTKEDIPTVVITPSDNVESNNIDTALVTSVDDQGTSVEPVSNNESVVTEPKIDIDQFLERSYQKVEDIQPSETPSQPVTEEVKAEEQPKTDEEPHYQLPSGEPVPPVQVENEYSVPDPTTYDVPRSAETAIIESAQVEPEKETVQIETVVTSAIVEEPIVSSESIVVKQVEEQSQVQSVLVAETETETMPNVDVKDKATKGSYTLPGKTSKAKKEKKPKVKKTKEPKEEKPKKEKEEKPEKERKSGLFAAVFRHTGRKSKNPAHDLPPVDAAITVNNETMETQPEQADPLQVPSNDLPKPNIELPVFDKPEADLTSGQSKESSEFTIPAVNLPTLAEVQQTIVETDVSASNEDPMKAPAIELPELQFTAETVTQETNSTLTNEVLPETTETVEVVQNELTDQVESVPTVADGIALATGLQESMESPVVYATETTLQIDTTVKVASDSTEVVIPTLPTPSPDEIEVVPLPELLTNEQKYTITDATFVTRPELPNLTEKVKAEQEEVESKITETVIPILSSPETDTTVVQDTVVSNVITAVDEAAIKVVTDIIPAVESETTATVETSKAEAKELIESKSIVKKKSSTLGLCSCFGAKSNAQKKTKTLAAPKAETPKTEETTEVVKESATKSKAPLRAPGTDLPPVDCSPAEPEPVRLPHIPLFHKKRAAPKKPKKQDESVKSEETPKEENAVASETVEKPEAEQNPAVESIENKAEEEMLVSPLINDEPVKDESESTTPTPVVTVESKAEEEPAQVQTDSQTGVAETASAESTNVTSTIIDQQETESVQVQSTTPINAVETEPTQEIKLTSNEPKKSPSFIIKAPALDIPSLDLSTPSKVDGYITSSKTEESVSSIAQIQSRSDSGLEAIISSHLQASSTFGTSPTLEDINQQTSISSGLGSEILDSVTVKTCTLPEIEQEKSSSEPKRDNNLRHDFTRKITMTDETRSKLIFCQDELKTCLENEIAQSIEDFDQKKDQKKLNKVLTHAIDLIKDKKVSTYPELKQKLTVEHKHDAFIVDPVVRSLYCAIENEGLDNIHTPDFALAIRDMVRLQAKQTYDTVTQLNKQTAEEPQKIPTETTTTTTATSSWLSCGRSKSKNKKSSTTAAKPTGAGLLDERRRLQLHAHRQELGNILRDHINSTEPAIRNFPDHPKEVEKIIRKSLTSVSHPKVLSYEQIRNELKTEFKQTFYLVDPIVDVVRDTFDHCDITQMNEKINLDILDSNISQTAQLYNQVSQQTNLLTPEEHNLLKSNQLNWVNGHLIENALKEKKINNKQSKELTKILARALNILSLNVVYTWDELNCQLRREFPKAHDLCDRSVELIKQAQTDGLLVLTQSPNSAAQDVTAINIIQSNGKRRASTLITDRARQNLKTNRPKIIATMANLVFEHNDPVYTKGQIENYLNKTFHYLEHQKPGQFKDYQELKNKLKKDYKSNNENLLEQIVDVIEQAHATNQFDDVEKSEVQTLMKDRLKGKPLVIKEMYVSLPPRTGAFAATKHNNDESSTHLSTSINGDRTLNSSTSSHRVARGLSWREANERARILFYRGKHPAIHYDEQAAGFDVRMLLETTAGGTQEIPVSDSDVHELLNSCGVQWDGVNLVSVVDHSEDVVRAAEQAALKVIRERGLVDIRTPPTQTTTDETDQPSTTT